MSPKNIGKRNLIGIIIWMIIVTTFMENIITFGFSTDSSVIHMVKISPQLEIRAFITVIIGYLLYQGIIGVKTILSIVLLFLGLAFSIGVISYFNLGMLILAISYIAMGVFLMKSKTISEYFYQKGMEKR